MINSLYHELSWTPNYNTYHHAQEVIPYGDGALGENLGSLCRQDSQNICLGYTFVAKNIPLNILSLPKISRPYTVSGENIPFNRPIQIFSE